MIPATTRMYRQARLPATTPVAFDVADAFRVVTSVQRVQEAFLREKDTNPFLGALYTAWQTRHDP
jgi:hypothetical protein